MSKADRQPEVGLTRTLTDWRAARRALLCLLPVAGAAAALPPAAALAQEKPAAAEQVDAATKKLTAAHGLFQRSLFKLAATQYTEFLQQYPQHPDGTTAKYALAVCRYRLAEYAPAIQAITEVLADPKFQQRDEALAVLGHSQLAGNHYEQALTAFDELLARHPESKHAETAALNRAQVLYLADKKPESLKAAQAFVEKYPRSAEKPTAQYFLALSQRDLKQHKEAAATLTELLAGAPDSRFSVDSMLLLGQCLEATGDLDGAAAQYAKMIAAAPQSRKADGQFSLGTLQYKTGKYDASIESLSAMLKESPASLYANAARLQLGLAQLATGKIDQARGTLTDIIDENKGHANEANYGLAQCDIAEKKFDAAKLKLDKLIAVQPPPANLAQVKLDHAVCLTELNQHEPAAAAFAAFVAAYPDAPQVPEALYRQSFSLHKLGKFEQSHELAGKVAKLPASDFTAPTAELDAENLFLLGKYPEAEKAFAALSADAKDDERKLQYAFRTGQSAYFQAKYPEASKLLAPLAENPAVAKNEPYHPAVFLLGDALLQQGKNDDAAVALKRFLEISKGDTLEARFKLGLAQLRAGKKEEAQQTFAAVAQGAADSQWVQRAQFEHGQMLYKAGKGPEAAQSLARVVAAANAPEEIAAPAVYLLGWVDFDAKKYPEAAARWTQLIEKYPKHTLTPDATFQRGVALSEAKQYEPALASLNAYTKAAPKGEHAAQARRLAAAALTALNRNDEAATMLAQLAGDASSASDAVLYDLAWSHRTKKDNAAAGAAYQQLLKKFPDSKLAPAAKAELAEFLYNDKKYDAAVKLLEDVAAAPDKAEPKTLAAAQYRLGWCYDKLKQPEKAAAAFTTFAGKNAKDELAASALLQAGLCYASYGEFPKAQALLKEMLAAFPQHAQANIALLRLGQIQADAQDFPASQASMTQFLQRFPQDAFAYQANFGVGWALENQKQFKAARDSYEKVIAAHNGETAARAQFQIGESLLKEGKFEEAVPALLAVEDVYAYPTWGAKALLMAGSAFEELKQADQAKAQYTAVVDKYKDLPEAKLAAERLAALKTSAAAAQ
jgi:TolA-binding protein